MIDHGTMAQQLYEEYAADADWMNFLNQRMPAWEFLPEKIQDHWAAVARKAAELLI